MMKISVPIEVEFDNIKSLPEDFEHLQTYKLHEGDDMTLVDAADVANILAKHIKAKESKPRTGRWIVYYHTPKDFSYSCNQCGYSAPYGLYGGEYSQKKWNYCPNCGCKMEVEQT